MSASNGYENSTGPDGQDAVLDALLRARRLGEVPAADAFPRGTWADAPLRSRSGGVNRPRAVVPAPLLAADALRLAADAHTKRARMVTAIGVPAAFLAATGVAVMPTVANAASTSSAASSTTCAPGSTAVANNGANTAPSSSAPSSAPSSSSKSGAAPSTPQPSSSPSTKPSVPGVPQPSGAPSGTSTPVKPSPTGVPSGTTAPPTSSSTAAAPKTTSTPTPTSTATWWNPLTWLGTTVNQVFNPAPSSSSSTVNKLAAAPANPTTSPTSSPSPILSIGLGGSSSSPSSAPSSPSSLPTTPQPTSSGTSKPSAPSSTATTPSSSASAPSGAVTYNGQVITPPSTVCVAAATDQPFREVEWHLDASSLTLTNQHFVGFQEIHTGDGRTVTVMAVHADRVDLTDMVTYNEDGTKRVYADGGKGKNVSLTNVTLHVLQQKGNLVAPVPLGPVTLGPDGEHGNDLGSLAAMALLQANLPLPLPPTVFTDVHVDQYTMTSDTLNIPGFNIRVS